MPHSLSLSNTDDYAFVDAQEILSILGILSGFFILLVFGSDVETKKTRTLRTLTCDCGSVPCGAADRCGTWLQQWP